MRPAFMVWKVTSGRAIEHLPNLWSSVQNLMFYIILLLIFMGVWVSLSSNVALLLSEFYSLLLYIWTCLSDWVFIKTRYLSWSLVRLILTPLLQVNHNCGAFVYPIWCVFPEIVTWFAMRGRHLIEGEKSEDPKRMQLKLFCASSESKCYWISLILWIASSFWFLWALGYACEESGAHVVQWRKNSGKDAEQILPDGRRLEEWGQQAWEGAHSIVETVACGAGCIPSLSICC